MRIIIPVELNESKSDSDYTISMFLYFFSEKSDDFFQISLCEIKVGREIDELLYEQY